jgi:hypothetical protein
MANWWEEGSTAVAVPKTQENFWEKDSTLIAASARPVETAMPEIMGPRYERRPSGTQIIEDTAFPAIDPEILKVAEGLKAGTVTPPVEPTQAVRLGTPKRPYTPYIQAGIGGYGVTPPDLAVRLGKHVLNAFPELAKGILSSPLSPASFSDEDLQPYMQQALNDVGKTFKGSAAETFKLAKTRAAQLAAEEKVPAFKIEAAKPGETGKKAIDIAGGLGKFVTQLAVLRRVAPKGAPDAVIWEMQNQLTGGVPGQGLATRKALGGIGRIPTGSMVGKVAKTGAESGLFAGITAVTGGNAEDIIVSALVPVAFNSWHFVKQKAYIQDYERQLRAEARKEYNKRIQEGMPEPFSRKHLEIDLRTVDTAVAKAKQRIYSDDAFAPAKDKWEAERQKALKMVATGRPEMVRRGNDILNFMATTAPPGEQLPIPTTRVGEVIETAKEIVTKPGQAIREAVRPTKPPVMPAGSALKPPQVAPEGVTPPPPAIETGKAPTAETGAVEPAAGKPLTRMSPKERNTFKLGMRAAFKMKDGRIIETGYVHTMPEGMKTEDIAEVGFTRPDTKEFLTREQAGELTGIDEGVELEQFSEEISEAPPEELPDRELAEELLSAREDRRPKEVVPIQQAPPAPAEGKGQPVPQVAGKKVIQAYVKDEQGNIYTANTHGEAYMKMEDAGGTEKAIRDSGFVVDGKLIPDSEINRGELEKQGYISQPPAPAEGQGQKQAWEMTYAEAERLYRQNTKKSVGQSQEMLEAMPTDELLALDDSRIAKGDLDAVVRQELATRYNALPHEYKYETDFQQWKESIRQAALSQQAGPTPSAEARGKLEGPEKPKGGGAGGSSVAAASAEATGSGYGTIAASEKSAFSEKTDHKRLNAEMPARPSLQIIDNTLKIAAPAIRGEQARATARVVRKNLGQLAQETSVLHETLKKAHRAFVFMQRDDIYSFIDRMENGQAQSTPKLEEISRKLRELLDDRRDRVQGLGKGLLEHFYENYFPHIWKNPKGAEAVIRQFFTKRRLQGPKSFLKKRTIMTVKEGREYGLELVSENPVDLVLLKLHEMDRFLMAHRIIQDMKGRGLIKFVYSRLKAPDGYIKIDDRAFTVYMPPEITKKEAYDVLLVDQLMDVARSMGIDTQRFVSIGGKRWGFAQWPHGAPGSGPFKVRTKYAGPESVLAHEIGHILGAKYNLYDTLRRVKEGGFRTVSRGEKAGEQKFVPAQEAVEHRKTIDKEWRALADARYKGQDVGPGFKGYVRKAEEKEAVMLEALIHAPDEFKAIAPTLHNLFTKFLNSHSELRPILDMKPSLVLGQSDAQIKIPGFTVLGHYYAPEPAARLLNNYLSPGLRNNENLLLSGGYNMLRKGGNILNQAQLSLSLWHALDTTIDTMNSTMAMGIRRLMTPEQRLAGLGNILSAPLAPILRTWDGIRLRRAYRNQIDTIEDPRLRSLVEAVVLANGRDKLDPFYYNHATKNLTNTLSQIIRGSGLEKLSGILRLPADAVTSTLEVLAKPLMEWYVPSGKMGVFSVMAEHEMKRAMTGQISDEQLHERLVRSWDSVDNRMGELVYDNLFWNKTLKDLLMLSMRSVGWNLGSFREYGGAPIDILMTKQRLNRGDLWLSLKMSYTISSVLLYGMIGAAIMYLLTGKGPDDDRDYFFPKTGRKNPDGSDERLSLPTYAKDWYGFGLQPIQQTRNKAHPFWSVLNDLVQNKDFFNVQIRDPKDPLSKQILAVAKHLGAEFLPLSAKNYQKMQKAEPGQQGKNLWVSLTGITSAPSYITRSPAQKLMYRYIVEKIPDKTVSTEQYELRMYRNNLKTLLRKGAPVDPIEAKKRLGLTEWNRLKTEAKKDPFAESFSRLGLEEALNVYAIASPEEKVKVSTVLRTKYNNAETKTKTPEIKELYNQLQGQQ